MTVDERQLGDIAILNEVEQLEGRRSECRWARRHRSWRFAGVRDDARLSGALAPQVGDVEDWAPSAGSRSLRRRRNAVAPRSSTTTPSTPMSPN